MGFYPYHRVHTIIGGGGRGGEGELRNQEDRTHRDYAVKVSSYQIKEEKLPLRWTPSGENGRVALKSLAVLIETH